MIIRSIIFAVLILVAYNIVVVKLFPNASALRHQRQGNASIAERYVYSTSATDNVIVGSSLAQRLPSEELPGYYVLAFAGQSALDGLSIISKRADKPKRVFIETNVMTRGEDKDFQGLFDNPLMYYGRKHIAALREGKQPIDVASHIVETGVNNIRPAQTTSHDQHGNLSFEKIVAVRVETYSANTDTAAIRKNVEKLKYYVDALTKEGVEVIFFEMPLNPALCDLQYATATRHEIMKVFPPDRYRHLPRPDCKEFITTDGEHLTADEAARYARYFMNAVDSTFKKM